MRNLRTFLNHFSVSDEEALSWEIETAEDRIVEYQQTLLDRDLSGASVRQYTAAIKRFFWDHRRRVYVSVRGIPTHRKYIDYIPSREDVQTILDNLKLHQKVGAALVAFSGLRLEDATGLQFQHIKASYMKGDENLTILKQHSKTSIWFVQYIGPQGTRYVRQLLTSRENKGHVLDDESFIVSMSGRRIKAQSLGKMIRRAILRTVGRHPTGEPFRRFRPYGLRKYFRRTADRLSDAEAEYLMGHYKGLMSLEATYNGLRDLDPRAIASLKKKYISILPELETEITDATLRVQLEDKEKEKKDLVEDLSSIREELDEIKAFIQMRREMDQ